jgi:hypothetical protein
VAAAAKVCGRCWMLGGGSGADTRSSSSSSDCQRQEWCACLLRCALMTVAGVAPSRL